MEIVMQLKHFENDMVCSTIICFWALLSILVVLFVASIILCSLYFSYYFFFESSVGIFGYMHKYNFCVYNTNICKTDSVGKYH